MLRLLLRRTHLVSSLVAGVWLAASGLTGALLVFGDALDQTLHPSLFVVRDAASRASLDRAIAAAEEASGGRAVRVRLAGTNTPVHEVWAGCDDCLRVWVDPSTARVNGVRTAHGTTRTFLHELHRRMLLRGAGDVAVLVSGVALVVLSLTGIVLGSRGGLRMRKASFYEAHRVAGLVVSPLLLIVGATGVYFIQAGLRASASAPPPAEVATRGSAERAWSVARAEFPAAEPAWIAWNANDLVVRFRQTAEDHPNGRTFVRVDGRTGAIVSSTDALRAPLSKKLVDNLYPLHIGATGGLVHKLILVVAGFMPAMLMITGVTLWLRRRSARARARTKRPRAAMELREAVSYVGRRE